MNALWQSLILTLGLALLLVWGAALLLKVIAHWKRLKLVERNVSMDRRLKENVIIGIHDEGERLILDETAPDAGRVLIDHAHQMMTKLGPARCQCLWAEADRLAEEAQS